MLSGTVRSADGRVPVLRPLGHPVTSHPLSGRAGSAFASDCGGYRRPDRPNRTENR